MPQRLKHGNPGQRRVEPEMLDSLPHDHPDARANRRDIRLINRLQGNFGWFSQTLSNHGVTHEVTPAAPWLELGAGSGDLARHLQNRGLIHPGRTDYTGIDLCPPPQDWPASWTWQQCDLATLGNVKPTCIILANFILHQFEDSILETLGARLRHARAILACEPLRARRAHLGLTAMNLLGINHVSRHDGRVSINAGFRNEELPRLLGLSETDWQIQIRETWLGCYRMVALRRKA